jgi:hypothetical protein
MSSPGISILKFGGRFRTESCFGVAMIEMKEIQQVKSCLTSKYNKPLNNGIIIEDLLDFWNKYHHEYIRGL